MTMTAAAARPARAKEPALALAAPVNLTGATPVAELGYVLAFQRFHFLTGRNAYPEYDQTAPDEEAAATPVEAAATGTDGQAPVAYVVAETGVAVVAKLEEPLQTPSLHVVFQELEKEAETGVAVVLLLTHSLQVGSAEVLLVQVMPEEESEAAPAGQLVTIGSQEVMVTSTVLVMVVVVPAEATATRPAAMAIEARILFDFVWSSGSNYRKRKIRGSEKHRAGCIIPTNVGELNSKRMDDRSQVLAWILKSRLGYRRK